MINAYDNMVKNGLFEIYGEEAEEKTAEKKITGKTENKRRTGDGKN